MSSNPDPENTAGTAERSGEFSNRLAPFVEQLAARTPAPGGGSAAAAALALGAALVQMAASYAIGNPRFADVESRLQGIGSRSRRTAAAALSCMDADGVSYGKFAQAMALPRKDRRAHANRCAALALASAESAAISAEILDLALAVKSDGAELARIGNQNLRSDAAGGSMLARAAATIALDNLKSNVEYCPQDCRQAQWLALRGRSELSLGLAADGVNLKSQA